MTLTPEAQSRIDAALARRKWEPVAGHPIAVLDGLRLGEYAVYAILGPKNAVGSRYFQLFLADAAGRLAEEELALGLFGAGPFPAFNWLELTQYSEALTFGGETLDLWSTGLETPLFDAITALVPPGGHMMVEYDSPTHKATERILTLRYPQAMSPLGYLLFEAGARSYRDWYISEGGREGPRKLQGFKPLNDDIAREKTENLRREVAEALARPAAPAHGEWGALARDLGGKVLERLG